MFEFTCYYEDGYSEPCSFWDAHIWPLADSLDRSEIAMAVKDSMLIVPWAGAVHLLALAVIGGLILMVDFRTLGFGLKSYGPAELERRLRPALIAAIVVMAISGSLLALGEVMRLYESPPYWMKMTALFSALLFTFAARPKILSGDEKLGTVRTVLAIIAVALCVYVFVLIAAALAWYAMGVLVLALGVLFLTGRRHAPPGEVVPFGMKLTAMTSLALWMTVAVSGRWIAFY